MITNSREEDFPTKQVANTSDTKTTISKPSSSSSTSWLKLKDPRIVRVSRAFGGKDRHSKVCTVRGLRDRRVRLSVPTAIQLYDLQDKLGLNQPSKVVDWLLNAAKHEIDELPPLQIPPGSFAQNFGSTMASSEKGVRISTSTINWELDATKISKPSFWSPDSSFLKAKRKEVARDDDQLMGERDQTNEDQPKQEEQGGTCAIQISSNNFLGRSASHSSIPGLMNNVISYNSCFHWEPSNFTLSNIGSHGGLFTSSQTDHNFHNPNLVPIHSSMTLPSGSQVLVCPPATTTQSFFPPHHVTSSSTEIDPRQINHLQMLSAVYPQNLFSSASSLTHSPLYSTRPLHSGLTTKAILHSQNTSESQPSQDTQEFTERY